MKPRTKTEQEVVRLSSRLPQLATKYKKEAEKLIDFKNAFRFRGLKTDVIHFLVVTTKGDWQVIRHFYLYASFKYRKLFKCDYLECMQQWYKDGKYVFMCLNRQMGYCNDAWCQGQQMSIKKDFNHCYTLSDPRDLGYQHVIYVNVQDRFSYLPADNETSLRVDMMFRAVNTNPFWETVIRKDPKMFKWCESGGFTEDKEMTAAVKIAMRYKYDFQSPEWSDLVRMLKYLGKDLHNPYYVCPRDLNAMHDEINVLATNKRKREREKREAVQRILRERRQLRWQEEAARRLEEKKEREQLAIVSYPKKRKVFFGLVIEGKGIEIRVLKSVQEFMEEGAAMNHCVYGNGYYDLNNHPNSLIMSARKDGERVETIEVNLKDYVVVQSRGKHNQLTPYHDTILELVNGNMDKIRELNTQKRRRVV
jgi:hypothetical protein